MSRIAVIVSSLVLAIACHESKSQTTAPPQAPPSAEAQPRGGPGHMGAMCPMGVPGTQVTAEDTQDGAAFVFRTTGDVALLRQRVHGMAAHHQLMMQRHGQGGMMGYGGMMGRGGMMQIPSNARAEDIPGGARLVLAPVDPAQIAELRGRVHAHAEMMASGECPMMHRGA